MCRHSAKREDVENQSINESINQSIKTLIQVDKPQRDKVKWIHMLKWIKNKMYNDKQQQ